MSCTGCFDNCPQGATPDVCVKYTGNDNTLLSIMQGDSLYQVLTALITAYNNTTDANKINLSSIGAGCAFFTQELAGKSLTVENVITALVDSVCCLKDTVTTLQGEVEPSISFDTSCLVVPEDPTIGDILQAAFTKICSLNTSITTINNDYVKATELCTLVNQCIAKNASTQEYTKMSKYIAYPYHGPTSVFDANGKGLAGSGYDKIYMCLGQTVNGFVIPDYRGRSPLGANTGIPTGGMDSAVNPAVPVNAAYATGNNQKKGEFAHSLTIQEEAPHTHTISDPGHIHNIQGLQKGAGDGANVVGREPGTLTKETNSATTGIIINSAGGGQPHNTTHPVIGSIFIMYVP